ncbi:MAG TPA: mechanosensitive ion channel family protein, partial [Candidatus Agrococcus pullicola]|nr:mechanosensitive ion channel family protein [Candidatus Agrococcus pullicola]
MWGALGGAAALIILRAISAAITRSRSRSKQVVKRLGTPVFALVFVTAAWSSATIMRIPRYWDEGATGNIHHTMQIVTIVAVAWLLIALVQAVSDALLARFKTDKATERRARRVQMQVQLMRRILSALIVIMAIGSVLFTFEQLRIAGTSLLASAGLVSVVAGLAATSALTNVFAGMQLAFSGAINLHDIVVVEDEWGRIEEITLTYVVVRIWDDRRLVLPSTYFTTTPFTNYTRTTIEKYGTIF